MFRQLGISEKVIYKQKFKKIKHTYLVPLQEKGKL